MNNNLTHRLVIKAKKSCLESLFSRLAEEGLEDYTTWEPNEADEVSVVFYRQDASDLKTLAPAVEAILAESDIAQSCSCTIDAIENEDWETAWKRFFHAAKVSEHIVVRPSWEEWKGESGLLEVVVDPGMSFGTGLHATTRACIGFLDALGGNAGSFLDIGCGSGILTIAAAKLGFGKIDAFDIDAEAVACTLRNIESNGLGAKSIAVKCADITSLRANLVYRAVAVNILAPVIESSIKNISQFVDPEGGHLILAGLDCGQFERISGLFLKEGFALLDRVEEGEWVSGLLRLEK